MTETYQYDPVTDGGDAADYDYHHVGSDIACDIAGDLPRGATAMEVSRAMHAYAKANAPAWVAERRAAFMDEHATDSETALKFAVAYVARYMARIRDGVHTYVEDRAARCEMCECVGCEVHCPDCGANMETEGDGREYCAVDCACSCHRCAS